MTAWSRCLFFALTLVALPAWAADDPAKAKLDYQRFVLPNGLTLIVHEDKRAPVASMALFFHVGSKDEVAGKTGFAHLFEHLMFTGSENARSKHIQALEELGATGVNGTTSNDVTNYYETVPIGALERLLWLESDRMRNLLGGVDQARLDEQRGVVKNEKRQREATAEARRGQRVNAVLYPVGHPYHHSVIGSMEDLDRASLDDVKQFFRNHYGAANTVIAVSGDVKTDDIKKRIEYWFGDIPAGPPHGRRLEQVPVLQERIVDRVTDSVSATWITRAWPTAGIHDDDMIYLTLIGPLLADGDASRLRKALVRDKQLANRVSAGVARRELAGYVDIEFDLRPGADADAAIAELDKQIAEFLRTGPTDAELKRAKARYLLGTTRNLETTLSQAQTLARNETTTGDAGYAVKVQEKIAGATREDVRRVAAKWMSRGYYQLRTDPAPTNEVATAVDRSKPPAVTATAAPPFPTPVEWTLSNGIKVTLAERHNWPTVDLAVMSPGGALSDGGKRGLSSMAMEMLAKGTSKHDVVAIQDMLRDDGASISSYSAMEFNYVRVSMLSGALDRPVELASEMLRSANVPEAELELLRKSRLAALKQQGLTAPSAVALAINPALFGPGHPYGLTTTMGTIESVAQITRNDIADYIATWIRPDVMTIAVAGDITRERATQLLEAQFGRWAKPATPAPSLAKPPILPVASKTRLLLIDVPRSQQATVVVAHLIAPDDRSSETEHAFTNAVFGGSFGSRINLNIRESKGWSYGVRSAVSSGRGQHAWSASMAVERDHAGDAITELKRELADILGPKPITDAEVDLRRTQSLAALAGQNETNGSLLAQLMYDRSVDHPLDYPLHRAERIRAINVETANKTAKTMWHPDGLTWIVAGDAGVLRPQLEKLNLAPIEMWTREGGAVDASKKDAQPTATPK
ncbi:M16 family metallopeptidase [Roseiterribacter gracilis]|uniref:Peptidase M16 n=1 Tax=Roseiterribacter gracilis TaxID=2812848 RepID=A0A8S8XDI7_9PROT|nr:peptidase M16 [Rhodospirillales bacterium TMPK1]